MADPKSSKEVNIADRLDILNKLEAGENINTLAHEYNVSNRTIRRIRQKALSIRQYAGEDFKLQKKRMRTSTSADLDKELYSWFLQRRLVGDRITDYILIEKARALQEERGGPSNFTPCKGWLWRFKKNYNLRLTNICDCIDLINETWTIITSTNIFNSWNKILNRETGIPEKIPALYDVACETISDEEVTEWINQCGEAERIREDNTEETDATDSQLPANPIEAEEVERLLYYLQKIIATEPEIPNHAKSIIDYYNSK
ncbi:unnamed protein product [Heterotrigona itama]|uniref:HTH CENPB-type domain-containing protein n=1 Tax=Heterotrigona itama TaxID=395501 RepID=A0A6V7GUY3_9HYME|nr:unnamed protein product [Heterotrigona itama]